MTDIVLDKITSGYNLSKINKNFEKVEDVINDEVLHLEGGNNVMKQDLDMNGHALLNLATNPNEPGSMLTVEQADARYVNVKGDTLEGPLNAGGQAITNLREPVGDSEPARKIDVDEEEDARIDADQNLQAQLTGTTPLEASAFSEISWHDQVIQNSVTIPANKNAWSFGPQMTIAQGQEVQVSEGSSWTIADGDEYEGPIDEATYIKKVDLAAADGSGLVGFGQDKTYVQGSLGFRFKRTLHSKDSPFNCKGDGVTDDSAGLAAMFDMSRTLGGNCEIVIDDGVHLCGSLLQCTSNTTVRFVGSLKAIANPSVGTDTLLLPVNGATNVTYLYPKVDLNSIPAMNGFICRTGHNGFLSIGGEVKNGVHAPSGTRGGRGAIIETLTTSLNNKAPKIIGLRVTNCYMGIGLQGGSGTAGSPAQGGRSLVLMDNISVDSCDIALGVFGVPSSGSTFTYPYVAEAMHALIGSIAIRNCGINTQYAGQDGVIALDRGCNITINQFSAFNSADYGDVSAVIRGNMSNCRIDGVFNGSAASVVSFSPYKESTTIVTSENSVQNCDINVDVYGTVVNFLTNNSYTAGYIQRTKVSGSATVVSSGRAIAASVVGQTGLMIDLYERTQNSRIIGAADVVASTLFSALPGKTIDLMLNRVAALECRGDLTISSLTPNTFFRDLSTSALDGKIGVDGNIFSLFMESAAASEVFNPFLTYNASTASGRLFSGTTAVFGWNAGYIFMPALGNYATDSAAAAGGVPVGGVYRNGNILQVRVS